MSSEVHFLPWERLSELPAWMRAVGALDHVCGRQHVAIKLHFGEEGNTGYIRPDLVRPFVDEAQRKGAWPFLTDANTIYVGQRADAVHHTMVAARHGFTVERCGCPVIIADGLRGNAGVEVAVHLSHFETVSIANAIHFADALIILSHVKGHELTGFGGALKNVGMGCATRAGKYAMHDRVHPKVARERCDGCGRCLAWCGGGALHLDDDRRIVLDEAVCTGCGECILTCPNRVFDVPWDESSLAMQEKMVEYCYGVLHGKPHVGVNFLNHITKVCDCYPTRGNPLLPDIGVLASSDPVALDQASADLVNERFGGDLWRHIFPRTDWTVQLAYAERLGLGSRQYRLVTAP